MPAPSSLAGRLSAFEKALSDTSLPVGYWENRWEFLRSTDELVLPEDILLAFFIPKSTALSPTVIASLKHVLGAQELKLANDAWKLCDDPTEFARLQISASPSHPQAQAASLALLMIAFAIYEKKLSEKDVKTYKDSWIAVADLCGRWRLRYVLEDVIFAFLEPEDYRLITSVVKKRGKQYLTILDDAIAIVRHQCMARGHSDIEIYARRKNIYGVYAKMRGDKKTLGQIRDIFGIRVLVKTVPECYAVLDIIQSLWPAYPEYFKDFIRHSKPNGYQSLHLTVSCLNQQDVEFQIRTFKMHEIAQFGIASHASYKSAARWEH